MDKKKEIINILLVSLDDRFAKNVVENLADILDMYNSDCKDLVVYDLIDPKDILEKCGIDYFKKREKAVLESLYNLKNKVITVITGIELNKTSKDLINYTKDLGNVIMINEQ